MFDKKQVRGVSSKRCMLVQNDNCHVLIELLLLKSNGKGLLKSNGKGLLKGLLNGKGLLKSNDKGFNSAELSRHEIDDLQGNICTE